jgi:hypothetical protein
VSSIGDVALPQQQIKKLPNMGAGLDLPHSAPEHTLISPQTQGGGRCAKLCWLLSQFS